MIINNFKLTIKLAFYLHIQSINVIINGKKEIYMNSEELKQKRNKILTLQTEVEELKRKQEELY